MTIDPSSALDITQNILVLERGKDELLLANYLELKPLYVNKGREYINNFMKNVKEIGSYQKIIEAFPQDKKLLNLLLNHGIIINRNTRPKKIKTNDCLKNSDLSNKKDISLYLLISQSCNLGCIYCLNGSKTYGKDKSLKMSKEVAFRSIERCLKDLAHDGSLEIVFFGGEPLLNWPLAKEIIIYCENELKKNNSEKIIKYHLTTNLSFLPRDLIEWAKKYNITFLVDVDGPEMIHNTCRPYKDGRPSHKNIVENIKMIASSGMEVSLRATVTALNQNHLLEIAKHHQEIGGASCAFVPVNPVNSDEDIFPESLLPSPHKVIKGMAQVFKSKVWEINQLFPFSQYAYKLMPGNRTYLGCGAPYGSTPVVDVNGDVYPCIYLVGIKRFYLGNILKDTYPEKHVLRWMYDVLHVNHMEQCQTCSWRYMCGGGCPVGRLTVLDNPLASKKVRNYCNLMNCGITKKILEMLLWEQAQKIASRSLEHLGYSKTVAIENTIFC